MANAYVNFYGDLDRGGFERGAQAFQGLASQEHRADGPVGTSAAPTVITLAPQTPGWVGATDETVYAEIKATSGNIFVCIIAAGSDEAERTAAKVRIDEGEKITLARSQLSAEPTLYLWAV